MKKVGFTWLLEQYKIQDFQLTHESYIGSTDKTEISLKNTVVRTFKSKYDVTDNNPMSHLEFALKYDDLNLALLHEVFVSIGHKAITQYVNKNPNRKYTRIIGYLYEFIVHKPIDVNVSTTNYDNVLDTSRYITGDTIKIPKWKINDNLLGHNSFCPTIRRTTELTALLDWDVEKAIKNLQSNYSPEIFKRASYYLFKKESKSSSEIEQETPSQDRMDKFIALLEIAGQKTFEETMSEAELVRIQNTIVDPRYKDHGYRNFQNYVGQTLRDFSQKIHYVCPPPQFVESLMQGLIDLNTKNTSTKTVIKAAMTSFGYVYIHPFEDGNGRIHRYLIHDILVRDRIVPNGTVLPVSAHILANMTDYDWTLETLSKWVGTKVKYKMDKQEKLTVTNPTKIEPLYRFPDLTNHSVFLAKAIQSSVQIDVPNELYFLQCYDEVKSEIQQIVDMPDKKLDQMIMFLHQNNGKLAARKRNVFNELTDDEIDQMEKAYSLVFNSSF